MLRYFEACEQVWQFFVFVGEIYYKYGTNSYLHKNALGRVLHQVFLECVCAVQQMLDTIEYSIYGVLGSNKKRKGEEKLGNSCHSVLLRGQRSK